MKTWKCTAKEVITHVWEVEATTRAEAVEIASNGCDNLDCESDRAQFGHITI